MRQCYSGFKIYFPSFKNTRLLVVLYFFVGILGFSSYAKQYSFKNYTATDGIGSSSINHIFQDKKGYIWFATQGGGVSRFDGNSFLNFTKKDGLISNDATYINQDKQGRIWIATAAGLSIFDGKQFKNYSQENGLTNGVVFCIYMDRKNTTWIATQDAGLILFDGENFKSITREQGLPTNEIYTITQDHSGKIWLGTAKGVASIFNDRITVYNDSTIKDNAYFSSLTDKSGQVWFGSVGDGLLLIDKNDSIRKIKLPMPAENDFIGGLTQDGEGNIWMASDHGLLKYKKDSFQLYGEQEGLSVNIVQTVMCDYEGNIWSGTLGGGIDMLSSEAFINFTASDGLSSKNITCIEADIADKIFWVGSSEGLFTYNSQSNPLFEKINGIDELENTNIVDLAIDTNGLIWICTHSAVYVLERKNDTYRIQTSIKEIAGNKLVSPTKILHDSKGNTWIASYGSGLFKFNSGEIKNDALKGTCYQIDSGFISNKILSLFEDQKSNIWIGTHDKGIVKFDGKDFQPLTKNEETGKSIWSITEDAQGNIFWSTLENGLFRYDGNEVYNYSKALNRRSIFNTALLWDEAEHCLWLGSEKGLSRLLFDTNFEIIKTQQFTEKDGFIPSGINQNAIVPANDKQIFLGSSNGLWLLDNKKISKKNIPPKIQLTNLRLFFEAVDWSAFTDSINVFSQLPIHLELPYKQNHLTFDIQALTTQDVRYSFMLKGQDKTWSVPGKNNEITYSNISPGENYTFLAKALNKDGIESDEPIVFSFSILPPWWQTWWFQLLAAIGIIGALLFIVKTREKVLKEQNLKLETTVKERTREIEHQKNIVEQTLSEKEELLLQKGVLLKEIHHRVKNNLQTISSLLMLQSSDITDDRAKNAIRESQNRVHSIAMVHQKLYQNEGVEKVELKNFTEDLCKQIQSMYPLDTQVEIQINMPQIYLPIDIAVPLGLIFNELLTNSFKYAFKGKNTGEITIKVRSKKPVTSGKIESKQNLHISYSDNGPGLKSSAQLNNPETLGLRLIQLLSSQIGAKVEYSNEIISKFIFTFKKAENPVIIENNG
ncbi:MAG: two-component regulator propeller domain-containing protein [Chitinophagales bacterium]